MSEDPNYGMFIRLNDLETCTASFIKEIGCPRCAGTGEVWKNWLDIPVTSAGGYEIKQAKTTCLVCGGAGIIKRLENG